MILLDLFFPKFCISCKKWKKYICDDCRKDIDFLNSYICPVCHESIHPQSIHEFCTSKTQVDGVISSMSYNKVAKKIVKAIKYQLIYDIYNELSEFIFTSEIFDEFNTNHQSCYLQPIPLYSKRLKMRGFNQAHELAKILSNKYHYPIIDSLKRVKDTKPQAQLKYKKQRQDNIKDAFIIHNETSIKGKNVILVDDVYTSGSTCLEAASVFKNAGVSKVYVWSLARD